jgi:DNA mismatch endonuclease (patch repair protein)
MGWHVIQFWECQLKPKVREENLQGLLYTLNKIMLLNYQAKPYWVEEVGQVGKIAESFYGF